MSLSPATRRMSPGSLVTTVIWPAGADWITAPRCALSYRDSSLAVDGRCGIGVGGVQRDVGDAQVVRESPCGGGPVPAGLDAGCCGDSHLDCGRAALTACHDLDVAHHLAVLAVSGIGEGLGCLVMHLRGFRRQSPRGESSARLTLSVRQPASSQALASRQIPTRNPGDKSFHFA